LRQIEQESRAVAGKPRDATNFSKWQPAAILELIEPEIAPFNPPTLKTMP